MTEYPDRDLWVVQDVLDSQAEGYNGRFIMLSSPQIEVAIGVMLNLDAPLANPVVIAVLPAQTVN
jgi:hypothetical protein